MIEHAYRYAEQGIPVFPCKADKTPHTEHGFLDATTSREQIGKWWEQWPNANIGRPTEGIAVVDIDPLPDGSANPWPGGERAGDISSCPIVLTPRGGTHRYFRQPPGIKVKSTNSVIAPNVDIKANGGYVLLPPSKTENGEYRWIEDYYENLPLPPSWLMQLPEVSPNIASEEPGKIPQGKRNDVLASIAGKLRQIGMSQKEMTAALQVANKDRCSLPLPVEEVNKIAWSIARKEPDGSRTAVAWDHYGQDRAAEPLLKIWTSKEFNSENFPIEYLVDGFLVANQPAVLGAPKKTLKTMVLEDICISLASGKKVLGYFGVPKPAAVLMLSGESGGSTLQQNARTIAKVKGISLDELPLYWSLDLPQLHHQDHMKELDAAIKDRGIRLCAIDPLYLCLLAGGNSAIASNVYAMGSAFRSVGEIGQKNQCTIMLVHHFKAAMREDKHTVPSLDDLSYAGISEFVRQWILLRRRKHYEGHRKHALWLAVGGSAGHSGQWEMDVDEGIEAFGDLDWKVEVRDIEQKKPKEKADTEANRLRLLETSRDIGPETKRELKTQSGVSFKVADSLIRTLLKDGALEECDVRKNSRLEKGVKLSMLGDQELKQHDQFLKLNQTDSGEDDDDELT